MTVPEPLHRLAQRYAAHDRGAAGLRRAVRCAILMPGSFALCLKVIGNPGMARFAAFGSIAMLLFVDFTGSLGDRARSQVALVVVGGAIVCLGTLCSRSVALSVAVMAVLGAAVIFSGVVSAALAGASNALLLAFILPVTTPGSASQIPDRLAGWGIAGGLSVLAVTLLWPAPALQALQMALVRTLRALATCVRHEDPSQAETTREQLRERLDALATTFLATPVRPTGLTTEARATVRLVDELRWLGQVVLGGSYAPAGTGLAQAARSLRTATASVLAQAAGLLAAPSAECGPLRAVHETQRTVAGELPDEVSAVATGHGARVQVTAMDPAFRVSEVSYMAGVVADNIEVIAAAGARGWLARALGRQPAGFPGPLASARERARAHLALRSVWARNAVRGGIALGLAILVARQLGVQHAFWVSLGTLSVLRSNALSTGQTYARALLGTLIGFIIGALVVSAVGTDTTLLWALLPITVLLAGVAPAAISFTAGQASFTFVLFILFNILAPMGVHLGFVRMEDIALGGGGSVIVGVLFWPRGAGSALARALADAYDESVRYLADVVGYAMSCCAPGIPQGVGVRPEALRAAAANRRLDDALRTYLAERGPKRIGLGAVATLVNGPAALRLAADAVLDLWNGAPDPSRGRFAAARELSLQTAALTEWYDALGDALTGAGAVPEPAASDAGAQVRLQRTIEDDLDAGDPARAAVAVRVLWTGDHLDAARRLQEIVAAPARAEREATADPLIPQASSRVGGSSPTARRWASSASRSASRLARRS